jgi:zinc D-Ala-D-Ala carboxypeptidase
MGTPSKLLAASMASLLLLALGSARPAAAYRFRRALREGTRGADVRALEVRIAGWFPARSKRLLRVDRMFGHRTELALRAFQRQRGLTVDGVAGPQTFGALARLEDPDGSTRHFGWGEFAQHRSGGCSRRSNRFAGTFRGGSVPAAAVKAHIRQLMWRLEAIRAKAGGASVEITSGFRSRAYNRCIGGARWSQHLYGFAADFRITGVGAHRERRLAKSSQMHGLQCYPSDTYNHVDLRMENRKLEWLHHWWWPETDAGGRHLTPSGGLCWGE